MNSVQQALTQYYNKVKSNSEIIFEETSDWQIIKKYITDKFSVIKLNPKQTEKLERYNFIYGQLSKKYTESQVVQMLMKIEKYKLSQNQAINDVQATKELFTIAIDVNKAFEIKLQLDLNREQLNLASKAGDFKSFAMLEKNRAKLLSMLPDKEETPGDTFEPHTIIVEFNPELIGAPPIDNLKEFLEEINVKHKVKIDTSFFEDAVLIPDDNE